MGICAGLSLVAVHKCNPWSAVSYKNISNEKAARGLVLLVTLRWDLDWFHPDLGKPFQSTVSTFYDLLTQTQQTSSSSSSSVLSLSSLSIQKVAAQISSTVSRRTNKRTEDELRERGAAARQKLMLGWQAQMLEWLQTQESASQFISSETISQ